MTIDRKEQIAFAREILPLVEASSNPADLERLHKITALVLKWSGFEDNGVAFDLSEYTYELAEIAKGKKDTGWKDKARQSLDEQLRG